jgi:hypothetical protein
VWAIAFALVAAFLYAISAVLQQRAAADAPASTAMRPSLVLHLLREPRWLVGYGADWTAFGCEAVALALGSLLVVQPLLSTGVLFALLVDARWSRRPMGPHDRLAAGALTLGLAAFLLGGRPAGGVDQAPLGEWLTWGTPALVLAAVGVVAGFRASGSARAVLFASTTGAAYGLTAALTKTTTSLLGDGLLTALTAWEPYALGALAAVGVLANQSAFQAGALSAALPTQVCTMQVVGIALGVAVFGERLSTDTPAEWALVVAAVAAMTAGIVQLARSAGAAAADTAATVAEAGSGVLDPAR